MADPFTITTGILGLVTVAVQSTGSLIRNIQGFQRFPSSITQLKGELVTLQTVLSSLETAIRDGVDDFAALELPVRQCGDACREFEAIVVKCTTHSEGNKRSIRDWTALKYYGDDIHSFKAMLESYKGTISVALADANLRTSRVTLNALNEYKEMIHTTTCDLESRLNEIGNKFQMFADREENPQGSPSHGVTAYQRHVEEEKQSLKQCIDICAQVSEHIDEFQLQLTSDVPPPSGESAGPAPTLPEISAVTPFEFITATTLQSCNVQLQTAGVWLRQRLSNIEKQLNEENAPLQRVPGIQAQEKERLEREAASVRTSLDVCQRAAAQASHRQNVIEDITMAEDGRQFIVSTVGDLILARNVKAGARSTQCLGQLSDDSFQLLVKTDLKTSAQT